jgi:GTPase SAR1 family protein
MTENIKLAIFGPVSAGKTTFNNALMSNKCSGMARKKLTMLPQIYQIVNDDEQIDTIEEIYQKNKSSNETILKLREDGTFDQEQHFTELIHNIHPIPDFIQLPDINATYSILDMPGLNCAGDTLYYDYVQKISATIDIYLIVFDINSGLNTTDEINILKFLVAQIQQNNHGYLHILINKCDNITINGDNITLADEELDELYKRIIEAINKYCAPIHDKVSISPLCSQKLYIYRSVKNDITTIEEAHLNDIILDELGKKGFDGEEKESSEKLNALTSARRRTLK